MTGNDGAWVNVPNSRLCTPDDKMPVMTTKIQHWIRSWNEPLAARNKQGEF
jgi:hypothetical protein